MVRPRKGLLAIPRHVLEIHEGRSKLSQTELILTAPLDGSKQAGCSTNMMKFTRNS